MLYEKHLFYRYNSLRNCEFFMNEGPCEAILIGPIPNDKTLNSHYKKQGDRDQKYSILVIDHKLYKCKMFLYSEHNKILSKETVVRVFDMLNEDIRSYVKNGVIDLKGASNRIKYFAHSNEIKNGIYGEYSEKYWYLYKVQLMKKQDVIGTIDSNEFSIDNINLLKVDVALDPFKEEILKFVLKKKEIKL